MRTVSDAYGYLSDQVPTCDLDRYWDGLRFAMDAAGFPINPIGGEPYPDEGSTWGEGGPHTNSCALTSDQVRQVASLLAATPFTALTKHLTAGGTAGLYPANRNWASPVVHSCAAGYYRGLVEFFQEAAAAGQCTVFWAA
ncbi:hypothetical protein GCM10027445_36500 [Amycolatopsis endophytica]|uniref:DUF1877 domain-containing protein n=1 Tax=Amycolatopsis endophytica TaxID=860233 RepID=A0A853BA40_9PSEU|nr:hypothetical protein [Amycolatopsis endophytica]